MCGLFDDMPKNSEMTANHEIVFTPFGWSHQVQPGIHWPLKEWLFVVSGAAGVIKAFLKLFVTGSSRTGNSLPAAYVSAETM